MRNVPRSWWLWGSISTKSLANLLWLIVVQHGHSKSNDRRLRSKDRKSRSEDLRRRRSPTTMDSSSHDFSLPQTDIGYLKARLKGINKSYKAAEEVKKVMGPYTDRKKKNKEAPKQEPIRKEEKLVSVSFCAVHDPARTSAPPADHLVSMRMIELGLQKVKIKESANQQEMKKIVDRCSPVRRGKFTYCITRSR